MVEVVDNAMLFATFVVREIVVLCTVRLYFLLNWSESEFEGLQLEEYDI